MERKVVMIVDDDRALREMLERHFEKKGFLVYGFDNFGEALQALEEIEHVQSVIADYNGSTSLLTGLEFAEVGAQMRPDVECWVVISLLPDIGEECARSLTKVTFLPKPMIVNAVSVNEFTQKIINKLK